MHLAAISTGVARDVIRSDVQQRQVFPEVQAQTLPAARVVYPHSVARGLAALYSEYNASFAKIAEANREWSEDYQYCPRDGDIAAAPIIQVDMAGLDSAMLDHLGGLSAAGAANILRGRIFEFENSWAAYRAHAINPTEAGPSAYDTLSRQMMDDLRYRHGKPIALLATTVDKLNSMKEAEFGAQSGATVSDETVQRLTGFNRLFGPDDFREYLQANGGRCDYMLYVRASDSPARLRDRSLAADDDLLIDPAMRRAIKANSLTFNIDNPDWDDADPRRINDTKLYLEDMGMAVSVTSAEELAEVAASLGDVRLRAKPALGAYGCYGHEVGFHSNKKFRYRMRQNLGLWGRYVVQPEISPALAVNEVDGAEYAFMDRVFCAMLADGPRFIGGQRVFLPIDSMDVKKGRLHIVKTAAVSEITSDEAQGRVSIFRAAA